MNLLYKTNSAETPTPPKKSVWTATTCRHTYNLTPGPWPNLTVERVRPWSNMLNRSAILSAPRPTDLPPLASSPQSAVCSLQCETPAASPDQRYQTKERATHNLLAHPHGEIPITETFTVLQVHREQLHFFKLHSSVFHYHISSRFHWATSQETLECSKWGCREYIDFHYGLVYQGWRTAQLFKTLSLVSQTTSKG